MSTALFDSWTPCDESFGALLRLLRVLDVLESKIWRNVDKRIILMRLNICILAINFQKKKKFFA